MNNSEKNLLKYIKHNREIALRELFSYLKDKEYYSVKFSEDIMEEILFKEISFDCMNGIRKRLNDDICELINGENSEIYLDLFKRLNYENVVEFGLELTEDFVKLMKIWSSDKIDKTWNLNWFYYDRVPIDKIDVSNMNFDGVKFDDCTFTGKIYNTNFKGSSNLKIDLGFCNKDISYSNFQDTALISTDYMDGSIIRGEVHNKKIVGASFRGVKGDVTIYPSHVENKNCSYVDFGQAYIGYNNENELDGVTIHHANLADCKTSFHNGTFISTILNPKKVKDKDLSYVKFGRILFTDNFDNCCIKHSDFTNSINAVINPQNITDKDLSGVNFKDANVVGSFDGCNINDASFEGVKSDITIDINKVIYNENTNFNGVNVINYNACVNKYNETIINVKEKKKILSLFENARFKS